MMDEQKAAKKVMQMEHHLGQLPVALKAILLAAEMVEQMVAAMVSEKAELTAVETDESTVGLMAGMKVVM